MPVKAVVPVEAVVPRLNGRSSDGSLEVGGGKENDENVLAGVWARLASANVPAWGQTNVILYVKAVVPEEDPGLGGAPSCRIGGAGLAG